MGSSRNLEVDDQTNVKKMLAISLSNTELSKFETFGRSKTGELRAGDIAPVKSATFLKT